MSTRQRVCSVFIAVILCTTAAISQSLNMEYFGNWHDPAIPALGFGRYAACWGYIAPDGREYALLGATNGTAIIDITDSLNLVLRAFIPGPLSSWREMKTYRHHAYIVTESSDTLNGAGVQIVDLSNLPASASLVKTYIWTHPSTGARISRAHSVSVSGNFLYLNGGNFNGIRILNISDPVNPQRAGEYVGPYIHDSFIRNDTLFASALGSGLDIVDVRNKSNPTRIKLLTYPPGYATFTHNAWTTTDGRYVVTSDETSSPPGNLKIWDIADIQNPVLVTEVSHSTAIAHNVFIKGRLAYVAWYTAGLRVVDVTNPASPQVVAYYDTYPSSDTTSFAGVWGADPFFPSGKVIISDMQTGLYVVRYTGDKRGVVTGAITDGKTGAPVKDVTLHFKEAAITRWTGNSGQYVFGYAPGTYRVVMEKEGYTSREVTLTVIEGVTTTLNLMLSPVTSVEDKDAIIPTGFALHQNYPNPFNPTTTIRFTLPREQRVQLIVLNVLGQEVLTVLNEVRSAGEHRVAVDVGTLPTGIYFYKLVAGEFVDVKKMILLR